MKNEMLYQDFYLQERDPVEYGARRVSADSKVDRIIAVTAIGRNVAYGSSKGGGGGSSPDPQIGQAALMQAQQGQQWLDFAKQQFAIGNERQEVTDALSQKVIEQQLATQDQTNAWAREDRERTKKVFQPLEDEFIDTAKNYATPEKQQAAAAEAVADVRQQSRMGQEANARQMASMGVNPNSGRWNATSRAQETLGSLSAAGAANNARQVVRDKGLALQADAINIGKGLASSTASAYGLGLNAGNAAMGSNAGANANWHQNNQIMGQGYGGAMQGYAGQASTLNSQWSNQIAANNAANASAGGLMSGIGSIAGAGIMAF